MLRTYTDNGPCLRLKIAPSFQGVSQASITATPVSRYFRIIFVLSFPFTHLHPHERLGTFCVLRTCVI